jgi:hypothetical protein
MDSRLGVWISVSPHVAPALSLLEESCASSIFSVCSPCTPCLALSRPQLAFNRYSVVNRLHQPKASAPSERRHIRKNQALKSDYVKTCWKAAGTSKVATEDFIPIDMNLAGVSIGFLTDGCVWELRQERKCLETCYRYLNLSRNQLCSPLCDTLQSAREMLGAVLSSAPFRAPCLSVGLGKVGRKVSR